MSDNELITLPEMPAVTGLQPRRRRRNVDAQLGVKIPKFTKLKFDPEAERQAHAPAVEQWRVEYPQLARAFDEANSSGCGGHVKLGDFARIARGYPQRRGKGRGENRDALARSPTGGGRFVDGGKADWSNHRSAALSGDLRYRDVAQNLDDPRYDPEDDPMDDLEGDRNGDHDGDGDHEPESSGVVAIV
jgi:hypothetical protein